MKQRGMAQRAAMVATGIAMATRIGLAGAGTGLGLQHRRSKSSHSRPGPIEFKRRQRSVRVNRSHSTRSSTRSSRTMPDDAGTWSGGGSAISMAWTAGPDVGAAFTGHFVSTTKPVEYQGRHQYRVATA